MSMHPSTRARGSALVLIMVIITLLMGFAALLTMTSLFGVRAVGASENWMRAFYLADSGAQSGIARVRASNGTLLPTVFSESIAQGSAAVDITTAGLSLYRIHSSGTYLNDTQQVEVYLRFTGGFSVPGAVSMSFSNGTAINSGTIRVKSFGTSMISGKDHDASGSLLADQTNAKYGLATHKVPGKKNFGVDYDGFGTSTIEGTPSAITNTTTSQASILKALRDYTVNNAEVTILGSATLSDAETGLYGTAAAPKLVYARTGVNGQISMRNSFTGYGTLVIEVDAADVNTVLDMTGYAKWYGLVLVYFRDRSEIDNKPLVSLSGDAQIVGGLSMFFNTEKIKIKGTGYLLSLTGNSSILYSNGLISNARGTETLVERSAAVVTYRIL